MEAEQTATTSLTSLTEIVKGYAASAWETVPTIVLGAVVLFLFWILSKVAKRGALKASERFVDDPSLRSLFGTLTSFVVIVFGIFTAAAIVFPGLAAGDLVGVLGLSSVAIGFAFKDIFQNFLAGILILSRRPFQIGDEVKAGGHYGTVEEINFRSTKLRTPDGLRVIIPNADIFTGSVEVYTAFESRRSHFSAGIGYDADIDQARDVILQAVQRSEGVLAEPAPQVLTWEHGGSSVNFDVRYWTAPQAGSVAASRSDVATNVKNALDDAAIEIPFPHQVVQFHDMAREAAS